MTKEDLLVLLCTSIHDENRMILKILSSLTSPESQKLIENTLKIMDAEIKEGMDQIYTPEDFSKKEYIS